MCKKIEEEKKEYSRLLLGYVRDIQTINFSTFKGFYPIFYKKIMDNLELNEKNGKSYFYKEIIITPVYRQNLLNHFKIEQVGQN